MYLFKVCIYVVKVSVFSFEKIFQLGPYPQSFGGNGFLKLSFFSCTHHRFLQVRQSRVLKASNPLKTF